LLRAFPDAVLDILRRNADRQSRHQGQHADGYAAMSPPPRLMSSVIPTPLSLPRALFHHTRMITDSPCPPARSVLHNALHGPLYGAAAVGSPGHVAGGP
jgi:hypothetical protein